MTQRTALVTGAGSGLGRALAAGLAREGYDVAIHSGSNLTRALALADELSGETGRRVEAFQADFSSGGGAQRLFEQFRARFDRLDLFVGNAGITAGGRILDLSEEVFDLVHNVDWKNGFFCLQQAARMMVETQTAGSIFLISSNHHAIVGSGNSPYSIAKESLVKLTKHAAVELARYGIRVNCIAPGWINTGEARMEGYYEDSIKTIPMRRWVQPEEILRWILFIDGPAGASLTGDTIELDGGVRLMSGDPKNYGLE